MSDNTSNVLYNEMREFILGAIYEIPEVGWVASGFVRVLWPEKEKEKDVWSTIKERVEKVVSTKITQEVYNDVSAKLTGIRDILLAYYNDPGKNNYENVLMLLREQIPSFQEKGYETPLLPLFTQVVNIYLLLLRDGIKNAEALQLSTKERTNLQKELSTKISEFEAYAQNWYKAGIPSGVSWDKQNKYIREYTLSVLYYLSYWLLIDPNNETQPVTNPVQSTLQIFSDPYGDGKRYFTQKVIDATDLQATYGKITHITIYGRKDFETWIQGAQVTYGPKKASKVGSGVASENYGVDAADFFDDGMGRVETTHPYGGEITVSDLNPITEVWGYTGNKVDIIYGIGFTFKDGAKTPLMGAKSLNKFTISYTGHILSNISAMGVSDQKLLNGGKGYAMGRVVFGFRRAESFPVATYPLYSLYKRTSLGDTYDVVNNQIEYDEKVASGWTGQGIVARLFDSNGDIGLYMARNKSNADVVRLFAGRAAYDAFTDAGWSKDGVLGYLSESEKTRFGPTQPLYFLVAGKPPRTMIEFNKQLFEAQQSVGWKSDGNTVQGFTLTVAS